jgi:sulfate adenylyltransferase subunit 1
VPTDQVAALEADSRSAGTRGGELDLALLLDGLAAEREQGITIDVAYRYFATPRRTFILADTPGHVQYTRNTVTGASTADAAVILVDARNGVVAQTRRHATVMALLGVPHVIFAVNKMDAVDWTEHRFRAVAADVQAVVGSLGLADTQIVPVSALTGGNVSEPVGPVAAWFTGPALLSLLESLDTSVSHELDPFRFPVQLVIRPRTAEHPDYRGLAGRLAAGTIAVGDAVVALPSGLTSTVRAIDSPGGPVQVAVAGQSVTILLADELDIGRGEVLAVPDTPPDVVRVLDGVVCWLAATPSRPNHRLLLKAGAATVQAMLIEAPEVWDIDLHQWGAAAGPLQLNDIARVRLRLAEPVAVDDYVVGRRTGGFLLIDPSSGETLAGGMVGDPLSGAFTPIAVRS